MAENQGNLPEEQTPAQKEQQKAEKKRLTTLKTLGIATEFGFIIVLPLLGFAYLGKWLDHRYNQHFFIFVGLILAIITSGLWFIRVIRDLMKDMSDL